MTEQTIFEIRENARQEICTRIKCTDYLEKSKSGLFCCPFCGSGHGKNATGALKYYPATNTVCCFGRCAKDTGGKGKSYDVIDLYRQKTGADYNTALEVLAQEIGFSLDPADHERIENGIKEHYKIMEKQTTAQNAPNSPTEPQNPEKDINAPETDKNSNTGKIEGDKPAADYTKYYEICRARLEDPAALSYLSARGISKETAAACGIGFDPAADPANAPGAGDKDRKPHPCPRIIIPTTPAHYVGRRTDGGTEYAKINAKDGTPGIFNARALYAQDVQIVFITEGVFDALSIIEAGGTAIALNSANNTETLLTALGKKKTAARLVISLDADGAGEAATKTLKEGLTRLQIPFIIADICSGAKDPNEALTADRAQFCRAVKEAQERAINTPAQEVQEETPAQDVQEMSVSDYLRQGIFEQDINYFKEYKDRKTGLHKDIDKHLTLYPGLAALGGASSLGKTTFIVNLIDNLLTRGETVLFFCLEQLPIEIITKSLARRLIQRDPTSRLTNIDIKNGATSAALEKIKQEYAEQAQNYRIIPGSFRTTAQDITDYVKKYRQEHGGESCKPVVIVDYLQLIAPPAGYKGGIREYTDENIKALKDMQKKNGLFVIMVSNFNRSSNNEPVSYESFKETSMIEYTCDYIWGLQLSILDAENEDFYTVRGTKGGRSERPLDQKRKLVHEAQTGNPKKVEFVSLKNRNGKQAFKAFFNYYPAHDLYTEDNKPPVKDEFTDATDAAEQFTD